MARDGARVVAKRDEAMRIIAICNAESRRRRAAQTLRLVRITGIAFEVG